MTTQLEIWYDPMTEAWVYYDENSDLVEVEPMTPEGGDCDLKFSDIDSFYEWYNSSSN